VSFYYSSVFSVFPLAIAYGALGVIFLSVAVASRGMRERPAILTGIAIIFVVLPVSEELWIAWNFGNACKSAGMVVNRTTQVAGLYDSTRTTYSGPPTPQAAKAFDKGGYQFYEMRGQKGYIHIEKIAGKWSSSVIERPTARYWFSIDSGKEVAHKVFRQQSKVVDTQTSETLALYTQFSREAPWFFIGLDRPNLACDGPEGGPYSKHSLLIYRDVIKPLNSASHTRL
jgi:hypothetical protein